jgi:hypothetical protein
MTDAKAPALRADVRDAALAAGLDEAVARFPQDVAAAAQAAAADLVDMPPLDGFGEPWPPMRVPVAR